jgi:hypothetical protein
MKNIKHKLRKLTVPVLVALALFVGAACTPTDVGVSQFPSHLRGWARCIVHHESRGDADAVSPTNDWGLFQINRSVWERTFVQFVERTEGRRASWRGDIFNSRLNGRFAYQVVYKAQGERAWSANRYC